MGQTLTHGVYLPDEGERNCYSGLAANWQILDNSVGTIAANTAALAGKAPLVHTHTVSQITDFPAYGNAAGTICEGNDSRLSDARTPVAHTHTKSDVTDLLNSNFIPSANNSYDLGSSSYQWNNVYSKGYYYNGTPWGLDKANEWTGINTFSAVSYGEKIQLKNTGLDLSNGNPAVSSICQHIIWWNDKNNTHYAKIHAWANDTNSSILLTSYYRADANTVITSTLRNQCGSTSKSFFPESNSDTDLGTSTNKWKSLNGINPGALSLPVFGTTYRQALDTTGWVLDGSAANTFTPSISGWLNIRISDLSGSYVVIQSGAITVSNHGAGAIPSSVLTRALAILFPVEAGESVSIRLNTTSVAGFIYPCQGNV